MHQLALLACALLINVAAGAESRPSETGSRVLKEWKFGTHTEWAGWSPGGMIKDVRVQPDGVAFMATTRDPLITGPVFELMTTNQQWVEVDLTTDGPGEAELFFTNTTAGLYGGFDGKWRVDVSVPSTSRQTVTVWPFWGGLKKVIRLRFDPPSEARCTLHAIRIVEAVGTGGPPKWTFAGTAGSWRGMHAATTETKAGQLDVHATKPQALIYTAVAPFKAADVSVLKLDAACPGERAIGLYWATQDKPELQGEPIPLEPAGSETIDLRRFPTWQGTVTGLAIGFGTKGGETLTLRSVAIEPNDPHQTLLRARHIGFERAINRPGEPVALQVILEHAGGPAFPGGKAEVVCDLLPGGRVESVLPAIAVGQRHTLSIPGQAKAAGEVNVRVSVSASSVPGTSAATGGGRYGTSAAVSDDRKGTQAGLRQANDFLAKLHIDPTVKDIWPATMPASEREQYPVPPPRPVKTRYNIGIYYFPGWAAGHDRWAKQADFPERKPVLGYYAEGDPKLADWHVKWAVENGISFFVYDWYWAKGEEQLREGLNDGFLKARYGDSMKFALMWANHGGFSDHTPEQLLAVTDYWIEHYFRRGNYLRVDAAAQAVADGEPGVPYVSFFAPNELLRCLGGEEQVKAAFEQMRARVKAAGLGGLHIAACAGSDPGYAARLQLAGFDSVTGYNYRRTGATTLQSPYRQYLLGHAPLWEAMLKAPLPYMPLLTIGWDSRPWAGPWAERRFDRRTEDLAEALGLLRKHLDAHGRNTALLEAWNEWGEGSYIEPNAEFGFRDLEAVRAAFAEPADWPVNVGPGDVQKGTADSRR
jgi:hypothetical protein